MAHLIGMMVFVCWASIILSVDKRIYNGETRDLMQFSMSALSFLYKVLGLALFLGLFFNKSFSWYDPIWIFVISYIAAFVISLLYSGIMRKATLARSVVHLVLLLVFIPALISVCRFVF